jgi:HAD superfamily hydrolase (TIGR01548 family)
VRRVRGERATLCAELARLRAPAPPSQANFLLARCRTAAFVHDALATQGIAVRRFAGRPGLADALRITLPGAARPFARLRRALQLALAPQALLFDLDGVIADTVRSYDAAVIATAASFGVALAPGDLAAAREEGDANDDWRLTQRLLARRGAPASLAQVTARFEGLYQGTKSAPGLRRHETLAVARPLLAQLARRLPLAIVTGRPRADALRFLVRFRLVPLFAAVIPREQGVKPSPAPVRAALRALRVERAWMAGDLPDDVTAARAAGCLALGVVPPRTPFERRAAALRRAGAAAVLPSLAALPELLP